MRSVAPALLFIAAVAGFTVLSLRYGLGRLPGDIVIRRNSFYFYAPITTGIFVSVILSLFFWLIRR